MNVMKHCGDPTTRPETASRGPSRSGSAGSDRTAGGSSDAESDTDDESSPMPMAPISMFGGPDDPTARFLATLRERTGAQPLEGSQRVNGCFHRDLKLENLIVTGDFDCKIIDYGSLKFTQSRDGGAMYGAFRTNFHPFDRIELDLRGHAHVQGAAFSCLRLKWADLVLI